MAEYFETRGEAERFMQEWYAKDRKPPVFFAKILNHGTEKWIVNYDPRQNPGASPYIKVLENHSSAIRQIVTAAVPPPPRPQPASSEPAVVAGGGYHSRPGEEERSQSLTLRSKYNVIVGEKATALAVKENAFHAGEGVAAFITFLDSPPNLNLNGDYLLLQGHLKCPCGKEFAFETNFYGAHSGGETRCPCGRGFGDGFTYSRSGYSSGFFLYFCPNRPGPVSVIIDDIVLVDEAKRRQLEADSKRIGEERRRQEEEARQVQLKQQRERDERLKQEQERAAATRRQRQAAGKCIVCGESLGWTDRISGRSQHRNCRN